MIRSGVNLDDAINAVYLNYEGILKKKGIQDKEQLKQKLKEYYSAQGINLDEHVKKITVDKFITLMMRMVIDTPNFGEERDLPEPQEDITPEEKGFREKEKKIEQNIQQRRNLREKIIEFIREEVKSFLPVERSVNERDSWEEENHDELAMLFDNVRQQFAEQAHHLGIEWSRFQEITESCYQEVMAENW